MNYEQITQYMQATHIYANVTDEEFAKMPVAHYMTVLGSVGYIGTDTPVEFLAAKELEKPVQENPADDDAE